MCLLALIMAISAGLRLHALAAKVFWFDETLSAGVAMMHWPQFFLTLWTREANSAFYLFLLHVWVALGTTHGIIRGLSLLFSVATIPVIYALGERLFGRVTGLLAAWFLAINAFHIRYAQEARGYTLVAFFAVVATWLLVRNMEEPASAKWGLYTAACAAAVYSHLFGLLVVMVHVLWIANSHRSGLPLRQFWRSLFWFFCALIPLAAFTLKARTSTVNWIGPTEPTLILKLGEEIAGNWGFRLVSVEAFAITVAAICAWRRLRGTDCRWNGWNYTLLFIWLFVPPALTIAVSWLHPVFLPRYLIICLPASILLVACGVARLRPRVIALALCVSISAFSLLGTIAYYHHDFDLTRDRWIAASSYVLDHAQPGDGAYFYTRMGRVPFEYYRSQRHPVPAWPQTLMSGNGDGLTWQDFDSVPIGESLRDAHPSGDRVWLILQFDTLPNGLPDRGSTFLRGYYGHGRHLMETKRFVGVTVLLFAREPGETAEATATNRFTATHF